MLRGARMMRGMIGRRAVFAITAAAATPLRPVAAQPWPARPVSVILPLAAGSASDAAVRIALEAVEPAVGTRFLVENVAAAAGQVGAERAVRAAPDGYTLAALNNSILTILPHLATQRLAFGLDDFAPIAGLATIPTLLGVHRDVPVRSVAELVALARAKPGELNYASGGVGSPQHLASEMFISQTGARMTHVPYRGATQAAADLAAGNVQVMFIAHSLALPFIDTGRIRFLAFAGAARSPQFPDLPTIAESGVPGYDYQSWIALFARSGTPVAIIDRLSADVLKALAAPAVQERMVKAGIEPWPMPPDRLASFVREDYSRWQGVIRAAGIKPE
jgi:tripartite-type tricarboxylate transporter receptor subunit TctC